MAKNKVEGVNVREQSPHQTHPHSPDQEMVKTIFDRCNASLTQRRRQMTQRDLDALGLKGDNARKDNEINHFGTNSDSNDEL